MNRINNKVLIIIIVVLAGIYLGKKFIGKNTERNFKEELVAIDTASVDKIVIKPKISPDELIFEKSDDRWRLKSGELSDDADQGMVKGMLNNMLSMKPERLVGVSSEKWQQYEVNDSLGIEVKAFSGDKLLTDFIVGKFNFHQATRAMSTFVRLKGEEEVYSVEGFLSSNFNQQFNGFRDKTFLKLKKDEIESIEFSYPGDSSFVLIKNQNEWKIGEMETDSVSTASYLAGLQNITKREFVDDFDSNSTPIYTMTIRLRDIDPINISCFVKDDENYILHSSMNEDAYFDSGNFDLFNKLLISQLELIEQ